MSVFSRFAPRLQQAIVARLGWASLRPVQEEAGIAILDGNNVVVLAPTAGGKTEAAMFPAISQLVEEPTDAVGVLYVAPIKALLNNQAERLGLYTEMVGLRRFVWHGDTSESERSSFLREPSELLMTTPESLEVMLISQRVDENILFKDLKLVVIDEVHAIAGTDRGAHLMSVLERLCRLTPHDVQRVGLSATVGNPATILDWLQGTSKRQGVIIDPPKQPSARQLLIMHRTDLSDLALDAARVAHGTKSLFFCQSRALAESVAEYMRRAGTNVYVHHSAVSQEERHLAEREFHNGSDACIVCTSTLELGIDVGDLGKVLQAEAPDTVSSFLQRMGRTGRRAGQAANTTFFCESEDGVLQAIALVELAKAGWVEDIAITGRCWPVLIHQILALALASNGVSVADTWEHLSRVPDFRRITLDEFDRLLRWMLEDESLRLASGRLIMGAKAERRFGRKNFMELYAVFSSPQSYTVQTIGGQSLGSLNQDFVDGLVEGVSCFLLGGRAWTVLQIRHRDREVRVESAPRGKKPTWGGFMPQFLGYTLCQAILGVLQSDEEYGYLDSLARTVLLGQRGRMRAIPELESGGIEDLGSELRWWTFAGGRINATLRYAITSIAPQVSILPDNFALRIRGDDLTENRLNEIINRISVREFWSNDELWQRIAAQLPNYRLSKFQPLMPRWVEEEVLAAFLLDRGGALRWLQRPKESLR